MRFVDRYIHVPVLIVNCREDDLTNGNADALVVSAFVNPMSIELWREEPDKEGNYTLTYFTTKNGTHYVADMPVKTFMELLNTSQ